MVLQSGRDAICRWTRYGSDKPQLCRHWKELRAGAAAPARKVLPTQPRVICSLTQSGSSYVVRSRCGRCCRCRFVRGAAARRPCFARPRRNSCRCFVSRPFKGAGITALGVGGSANGSSFEMSGVLPSGFEAPTGQNRGVLLPHGCPRAKEGAGEPIIAALPMPWALPAHGLWPPLRARLVRLSPIRAMGSHGVAFPPVLASAGGFSVHSAHGQHLCAARHWPPWAARRRGIHTLSPFSTAGMVICSRPRLCGRGVQGRAGIRSCSCVWLMLWL